jgi:Ca2+-binding EF-hand superfamily protein
VRSPQVFDGDGNDELDLDEFVHGLSQHYEPDALRQIFAKIDVTGKGTVTFDEFRDWCAHSPQPLGEG